MKIPGLRWHVALLAAAAAALCHTGGVLLLKGVPILGNSELAEALDVEALEPADPLRLTLGEGVWAPLESPGPRVALEPAALRPAPELGPVIEDLRERMRLASPLFLTPNEGGGHRPVPMENLRGQDWALSLETNLFDARRTVHVLPDVFVSPVRLEAAARSLRQPLDATEVARGLVMPEPALPRPIPPPELGRPIRVPEVFVDVISH